MTSPPMQEGTAAADAGPGPVVVVVMGVTGAGKTTIGTLLAEDLGWSFYDADAFHPAENVERMRAGEPLSDAEREPWLAALEALIARVLTGGHSAVLACSALRAEYRERLRRAAEGSSGSVRVVHLKISLEEARRRLQARVGHFMPASLVESQFQTLEEPHEVLALDGTRPPAELVATIREWLNV